ncbi:hypothetical protein [Streptomyces chilikensis]|uniref:Secreted protein n=1 Tax=Streptomyces chilikensis TaxID=1194079 RepID=A0ABV3ERQ2_9ACTN
MRTRTTTTAVLLTACLALAGCSSSSDDKPAAQDTPAATTTQAPAPEPSAEPSMDQAVIAEQCTRAVAEAAPGWDDWSFAPGGWQDDPRTPDVCLGLADEENPSRGNRAFMDALVQGLEQADDPRANQ